MSYNKHAEHHDRTSLGKLRSKYWTTKQLVIKKLGREQDEFVIASDADVDAKLELLSAIKRSCNELINIMENYQNNVLFLSHDETDMARFLKDYAQLDKTRAGKMMASVSKVLAYTAQQRLTLRQPLLRLYNEIETFRHRAVTDTLMTVKRMETARTEYRGSILWLKDASVQLDPDKQLEKFRRVQSQVKTSKLEYDQLKSDVIQKIDLLTASRCNMYSHVLAAYQKTLLVFWEKTAKTMSAVAESFKGYQHYEFTVIKSLAEPSRLLAERNSSTFIDKTKQEEEEEEDNQDQLIDFDQSNDKPLPKDDDSKEQIIDLTEPVNALIDITDSQLDDQLLELEKLTAIEQSQTLSVHKSSEISPTKSTTDDNLVDLFDSSVDHDKLFSDILSSLTLDSFNNNNTNNMNTSSDADWIAAFGTGQTTNQQVPISTNKTDSNNTFLPSSLLNEFLSTTNKTNQSSIPTSTNQIENKSNWLDLFAELDPIQNPDAIGKISTDEFDRNC